MCFASVSIANFSIDVSAADETSNLLKSDYVYFGSYPQSKVTDSATISALNSLAPEWDEWTSYGYYNNGVQGDWMRYTDVIYNNEKYRGVKFTQYRNCEDYNTTHYQYENNYYTGTSYWFKFEILKWRVLDRNTGLILCESIIDAQPYSNVVYKGSDGYDYNSASYTHYASDYATSSIRRWLNNDFYDTAFSALGQQVSILCTTINNDSENTLKGITGYEKFDSAETRDHVFLLSYNEVINSSYGFTSSASYSCTKRRTQGSDYAKCQGLEVSSNSSWFGKSDWILRTSSGGSTCSVVMDSGYAGTSSNVNSCNCGIRPALVLKLSPHYHSYTAEVTKKATHFSEGELTYICFCGETKTEPIEKLTYHKWDDGTVITPATHLKEGVMTYTCACGETKTEPIAKLTAHTWDNGKETTPATHLKEGVMTYTCACGEIKTEPIAKLTAHTWDNGKETTPATHLKEGVMTYTCACGETKAEPIAKLTDHKWDNGTVTTPATHLKEGVMTYKCACGETKAEPIAKLTDHKWDNGTVTTPATHLKEGVMTYKCACGETKAEPIAKLTDHKWDNGTVTTPATHLKEGVMIYTCTCGETKTEPIAKLADHKWDNGTVTTPATHLKEGIMTYKCACGESYTEPIVKTTEHSYTSEVTKQPTHTEEGETTYTCACGASYMKPIAKTDKHSYSTAITKPTCSSKGYTTYTCVCGDSYVSDYVAMLSHDYTSSVTKQPTHLTEGAHTYVCKNCGNTYTEKIAKTPDHTYTTKTVSPTCTENGYTLHTCVCGDSYKDNYISATGHNYNNSTCENCGKKCSCSCHKTGIAHFFFVIINFFQKLFGQNKVCACGAKH